MKKYWHALPIAISLVFLLAISMGIREASAQSLCSPASVISVPFTKDGVGDFCWQTTSLCTAINSWNLTKLEVNGIAYTNTYISSSAIAPLNGTYTIHYVSTVAWGHFEISAPCSGGGATSTPTLGASPTNIVGASPTRTKTLTPITPAITATRTRTATSGPSLTPTRTATRTNTPAIANTLTRTPTRSLTPAITNTLTRTPTQIVGASPTIISDQHLANPFVGAVWYLNPDYTALVNAAATSMGGALGTQMAKVANYNTGIWLDTIDAVNGTNGYPRSLAGHLNAALAQNANLVTIVLYDMPNRNCTQSPSDGELLIANNGLNRYKTEFIDVIANTIANPAYANLRIVAIIEPDALSHMNPGHVQAYPSCQEASTSGAYVQAIQYALNKFEPIQNVYSYLDIGRADMPGGWETSFAPTVSLYASTINGTTAGSNSIDGFISNTANYSPVNEPFMTANQMVGGNPIYFASFYEWNPYIDEANFAAAWKNQIINAHGFSPSNANMLVDTSRNGWGGSSYGRTRPTAPSTSTSLNTFVDESRIDRRFERGEWTWCNQAGGIGAIPQANPSSIFQAYLWVKPPGTSDGSSVAIPVGPQNPKGKGFNRLCDPLYAGVQGRLRPTGAMSNAPVAGVWFQDAFVTLVTNAYPPLP